MATWKVGYFSGAGGVPSTMLEHATEVIEVTVMDPGFAGVVKDRSSTPRRLTDHGRR